MRTTNNRWAAVAGLAQWVIAAWCVQIAFAHSITELMAPAALSLISGCVTVLGFLKHESINEELEELRVSSN